MPTVVLIGTLDTKGVEFDFVRKRVKRAGLDVIVVDAGVLGRPQIRPDVTREAVALAAGADVRALAEAGDRGAAVTAMSRGAAVVARRLFAQNALHGIMGMGGSGRREMSVMAGARVAGDRPPRPLPWRRG